MESLGAPTHAVSAAAELGVQVVVVHVSPFDFPATELEERVRQVVQTCEALAPVLADSRVCLALENVLPGPATDLVGRALELLDPAWFGFCYDSSHDQIGGSCPMPRLRHRLIPSALR